MTLYRAGIALLLAGLLAGPSGRVTADGLARGFASPPASARPWVYWFWLNGNITREGITADLEAMQRVGIGGVLIMEVDQGAPVGPVSFASPRWRELFAHVVREAHRLGLEVNMNDDAGWNGSGGPWITPDKAMQKTVWTETPVTGPGTVTLALPQPAAVAGFYRDIAVLAYPTPAEGRLPDLPGKSSLVRWDAPPPASYPVLPAAQCLPRERVLDLTDRLAADGRLTWNVPEGQWTVLRLGHTPTGAVNAPAPESGRGLECDKLSPEGAEAAFNGLIGKLADDCGRLTGNSFAATHIDSWENGSQNWTPRLPEEFRHRRGYDLRPFLPVLAGRVVGSSELSERFLSDFRQTISDLLLDHYAGHMRGLARRRGLRLTIEAYGDGPTDNLAYAGRADEPMGEFWSWPGFGAGETLTQMASAAHVYGKPIIGAEAFTADNNERWLGHPGSIKAEGDWAFCLGINRFVFHRYALQPWLDRRPGMTMGPWGLHYERTQTWWEQSGPWHAYLARCQYLLRQGLPVVDALYLAPEGAPRSFGPPTDIGRAGYKADACPAEALLQRVSVRAGRLVLPDGMSYRALVLPATTVMSREVLAKVAQLARGGATIVGEPPRRTPGLAGYPECDRELQVAAQALWASGRILPRRPMAEVLAAHGVPPDFVSDRRLSFIHRRGGATDLYFVANASPVAISATGTFRMVAGRPEFWHPETGLIEPAPVYEQSRGLTRMPLHLPPSGSVFVVFRPAAPAEHVVRLTRGGERLWPVVAPRPVITIQRAAWGPLATRTRDVTKVLQRLVNNGARSFVVSELVGEVGDPAPMVLKTLRVEYQTGGQTLEARATDPERVTFAAPAGATVAITRALWGPEGEDTNLEKRTKDVTAQVRRIVSGGTTAFTVADLAAEGDPAPNIVKTLRVDYTSDGQALHAAATDPQMIEFEAPAAATTPVELAGTAAGGLRVLATAAGTYVATTSTGRTLRCEASAPLQLAVNGPWELSCPPGGGAPARVSFDKLVSWGERPEPGLRHFSGTATYRTTLTVPPAAMRPDVRLLLDLGRVEVMARVRVNGRDMGLLWTPPCRVDVTRAAHAGANTLEVAVTNLWPNRLIGDEQLPEDSDRRGDGTLKAWPAWLLEGKPSPTGRLTFTSWRLWRADDELLPSGLLGPVRLEAVRLLSMH